MITTGGIGNKIQDLEKLIFNNQPNFDQRGEFTRVFDIHQLETTIGRRVKFSQVSVSNSKMKFTRRGMHVRKLPELEFKFVRVIRGVVLDVILDCRPESKSFGSWAMFKLEALNGDGIIVPGGFAHGIQTLTDDTTLIYAMEIPYDSNLDITINSEDFDLGIKWGENFNSISDKDRNGISWQNYINFFKPTS